MRAHGPALMDAPGVSTGTSAVMLIVLGDNPQRIRSETAFAKLCGVRPVPASSGKTNSTAVATDGRMRLCTASPWFACATIRRPANISSAEPPKASHFAKSGGVSNSTSPAKSTNTSGLKSRPQQPRNALDQHRSINAVAESFSSSLKCERTRRSTHKTREEARQDVFDYVEMFYNPVRKQVRNGMLSPMEFERQQVLKAEGVQKSWGYSVPI